MKILKPSRAAAHTARAAEWLKRFRWARLLVIWAAFIEIALVLFVERAGVRYASSPLKIGYLGDSQAIPAQTALFGADAQTLVLYDSTQAGVDEAKEQFEHILQDMKLATDEVDVSFAAALPDFSAYARVIVLMPRLDALGQGLIDLMSWVDSGGSALFPMTFEYSSYLMAYASRLGIQWTSGGYSVAESIVPSADYMLGGGERYDFTDPFESSLSVTLRGDSEVCAATGDGGLPLLWRAHSGSGTVVCCNIGIYGKVMRGFYASAVSLLGDACAYPVINSATFYLDDFPSPVPGGNGEYVYRDYGLSIADFYSKVWWPDVSRLGEKYGVKFTGVMIESYSDDTADEPQRQTDVSQFRYYGGMLLSRGGEVGYHGYNHQPLCPGDTDYGDEYDYNTWPDALSIASSLDELASFKDSVLPNAVSSVYVPPSNVLSAAGRKVFSSHPEGIRTIASTYFGDGTPFPYVQEFGVSADGIVEQPRIVSGSVEGDDFMRLAAVSELNMHYVSTHFMHPDDLLDPDRGAVQGWEAYKQGLTGYLDWLEGAAPDIRKLTGSDCSGAVQRFSSVTVDESSSDDAWDLSLGNFVDEAWLFFRSNDGEPGDVEGGSLTHLTGNLYLLHATSASVRIARTGASS